MNIKKEEKQIIKTNIKSGNIIEIKGNNYYLIVHQSSTDKLLLCNLRTFSTVYGEFTPEEIYNNYEITAIHTNSDLILK